MKAEHAEYFNIENRLAARLLDRGIDARVCMFRMAFGFQGGIVVSGVKRGAFEYVLGVDGRRGPIGIFN